MFHRPHRLVLLALVVAAVVSPAETLAGQLILTWTDSSSNEAGFEIERSTGQTGTFAQIATQGANATSYADSNLSDGTTYCYRMRAFNTVGYSNYSNIACAATPVSYSLSVVPSGTGSGTVGSTPAGISCGADCSEPYPSGTTVTLVAAAAAGSVFAGWSGGGCGGTGSCALTLTGNALVTSTFTALTSVPSTYALSVARAGNGSGMVSSTPAGISCGTDCSETYPSGSSVTLTAAPAAGSSFAGWKGGSCRGKGSCTVTLTADMGITASFKRDRPGH